eukprot:364759-Chlamydomonas_euryale.AAC.20
MTFPPFPLAPGAVRAQLAGVLGGGLFAAAAALAVAGTTVLRGRVHVEWHRWGASAAAAVAVVEQRDASLC